MIHLKGSVGRLKAQVLLENGTTISLVNKILLRIFHSNMTSHSLGLPWIVNNCALQKGRFLWIPDLHMGLLLKHISESLIQRLPVRFFLECMSWKRIVSIPDIVVRRKDRVNELRSTDVDLSLTIHSILASNLRFKAFWRYKKLSYRKGRIKDVLLFLRGLFSKLKRLI